MFQHVTMKRGLSEDEARWFFQQLVLGLDYCHKMGIVNRDIKLEVSPIPGTHCRNTGKSCSTAETASMWRPFADFHVICVRRTPCSTAAGGHC